ncbi:MAG: hypothetical protein AAF623_13885, partial [Planctomycetota bacterium]
SIRSCFSKEMDDLADDTDNWPIFARMDVKKNQQTCLIFGTTYWWVGGLCQTFVEFRREWNFD